MRSATEKPKDWGGRTGAKNTESFIKSTLSALCFSKLSFYLSVVKLLNTSLQKILRNYFCFF